MKSYPCNLPPAILADFELLQPETIVLSAETIQRSVQASRRTEVQGNGWENYRVLLALAGFRQWMAERTWDLSLDESRGVLLSPNQPGTSICTIAVQGKGSDAFRVGLMAIDDWSEDSIEFPPLDQPDHAVQFYVLMQVQEEQGWVRVHSFLSVDRLREIPQGETGLYQVLLDKFEPDPDSLLLYLQCLHPSAVPLPSPQGSRPLQGYTVYPLPTLFTSELSSLHQSAQALINTASWLRDELDQVGRALAWVLLPTVAPAVPSPMMSPVEELEAIVSELNRTGTVVPSRSRGAYQDFQLADVGLRLYAMVWPLLEVADMPEWSLLLILGTPSGGSFPQGVRFQVSDPTQVLLERTLRPDRPDTYLYARVAGTWEETFVVTIALDNGATLTLPPFAFQIP